MLNEDAMVLPVSASVVVATWKFVLFVVIATDCEKTLPVIRMKKKKRSLYAGNIFFIGVLGAQNNNFYFGPKSNRMKSAAALLLFCFCFYLSFAQRISIQPSILDYHLGASGSQTQSVTVTNLSDKKLVFQAYLADWLRDSSGGHQYFRPDTLSRSCASWVSLNKNMIELAPNQSQEILVHMQTPSDAVKLNEMKWAMLFLQSVEEQDAASRANKQMQTQVKEILRVGVHIYETPPTVTAYKAKAVSLAPLTAEKNTYEFVLKNTGGNMLQCKAYMELTNVADGKSYTTEKTEFPVFPDGVRKVKLLLPAELPKGKYSALAILDPGADLPLEAVEKAVEVK